MSPSCDGGNISGDAKTQAEILDLFFKDSLTCFVLLDWDFNFIRVNKAYADVCARDVADFPGRNHFEMYPSPLEETFIRVREEKRPWEVFSRPFSFPDHPEWGVTYWDLKLEPILDAQGEIHMFVFSLIDVTKHAKAEQEVRRLKEELESKVNLFTRIASDWYWELDENLNVKSIGPGYTDITGIRAEEHIGKHRPNMRPDGFSPELWDQHVQDLYNQVPFHDFEYPRPTPHAPQTWLSVSGEPVFDSDGVFKGYRGTGRDITKRKLAELALRDSEHHQEEAQRIAHLGSWRWNLKDNSESWSDEQYRIFGYEPGEVEANYDLFVKAIHPDDRDEVLQAVQDTLANDKPYNATFRITRPNKEVRHVLAQGQVTRDEKGDAVAMAGTVLDVTERRGIESQLLQASKLATLGEMSTEMAHELNQPMNVIHLALKNIERKMAKGDLDREWLGQKLRRISDQANRASSIIDHMRIFGRKQEGKPGKIDLVECVERSLDLTLEQMRLDDIRVDLDMPEHDVFVSGYQIQLEQVLINLLSNARQAIRKNPEKGGGEIRIQIQRKEDQGVAALSVADTGGGIPDDVIERIFEPFYTTKAEGDGTGLGLSITYGIVNDMGGEISVQNEGRGAVFTLVLPTV